MIHRFLIVALFSLAALMPMGTQAASTAWNYVIPHPLAYFWNRFGGSGWAPAIGTNANVTITYTATVEDVATGTVIAPGSNVQVGQALRLRFKDFESTDISWFGTGYSSDSPYGEWRANAATPSVNAGVGICLEKDYIGRGMYCETSLGGGFPPVISVSCNSWTIYAPLVLHPPTRTITNTSGLTCNALQADGTMTCTVAAEGALTPSFNFAATYGKFYYRYFDRFQLCWAGNNYALRRQNDGTTGTILTAGVPVAGSDYIMSVSAQAISYPLIAGPANAAPATPTITGATTGRSDTSYTFTLYSTDSDNDALRYGVDWDMNGTVDEWAPAAGYVASGESRDVAHSWSTTDEKSFRALAQDDNGASSGWATHTITLSDPECSDGVDNDGDTFFDYDGGDLGCSSDDDTTEDPNPTPPPAAGTAVIMAVPDRVRSGTDATISWSAQNVTSCSVAGPNLSWSGTADASFMIASTSQTARIDTQATFTIECEASGTDSVTVNVLPSATEF